MSAPTSDTDICNLAMDYLGQTANVTNIQTPQTESEKKCARWYDADRRALLRAFPWTFARARAQLSRDSVTPTHSWADAYNLPNDYIRLNFIGDDSVLDLEGKYALEGRQLKLDNSGAASINIGYTKDESVVTKFDSLFVKLLAIEISLDLSFAFTLKPSILARLEVRANILRIEAKAVNSQERPPIRIENSKFVNARKRLLTTGAGKNTVFDR